ncbi:MAG: HEAT repeat domain-containing protein [Myxococcota bacterium]|jgi:HEAT repeat protein|nr:HEAT repeat domain-containing protein [Myxococcota bacterium]
MGARITRWSIGAAAALCFVGCTGSLTGLRRSIEAGDLSRVASVAMSDPRSAKAVSALVVEQRLRRCEEEPCDAPSLVSALAASGRMGAPSLERLGEEGREPVRSLCRIALQRGGDPPKDSGALMTHDSSSVREAFAAAFASKQSDSQLLVLAVDTSPGVRRAAIAAMVQRPMNPQSVETAKRALRSDPSPLVRLTAARAGRHLGEDAHLRLVAALEDESQGVALAAIDGLLELGTAEAMDRLERLSLVPSSPLLAHALAALCRAGRETSCQLLIERLGDGSLTHRRASILELVPLASLEKVRNAVSASSYKAVSAALNDVAKGEDPWILDSLLLLAGVSLAKAEPVPLRETESSVDELRKGLKSLVESRGHQRFEALLLLGRGGDESAHEKASLELDAKVEEGVLGSRLALTSAAPSAWQAVARLLGDGRPAVRLAAATSLLHTNL